MCDEWHQNLECGKLIRAVFLDIRKAFDSVDHKVFIKVNWTLKKSDLKIQTTLIMNNTNGPNNAVNLLRQAVNLLQSASGSQSTQISTNLHLQPIQGQSLPTSLQATFNQQPSTATFRNQPSTATLNQPSTATFRNQTSTATLNQPSTAILSQPSTSANQPSEAVDEHRRLFSRQSRIQPYGTRRGRRGAARKEKTITKTMLCLANKNQMSYPQLNETGGFQMLLTKEKKRKELRIVCHGSCNTEQLRCFGTGRIYLRPLQKSIPLPININVKEEFQQCLTCGGSFAVSEMRRHMNTCQVCISLTF
ncbi:Hypothetical predicted protein [Paramuricea clavata]|uniref:Uncharacterized protein n=1 Tax=Paramuricea clavata TaxID=317549 RepID=A0A7D9HDA1_PARCT|nr:Hypothetical predicted protein [Paramuricea clavata]